MENEYEGKVRGKWNTVNWYYDRFERVISLLSFFYYLKMRVP